ncbi:MAG: AzlD domain-containing protein [Desulfovibrionaceae bacterium]|jgi:branched-subunit amino acid transport protein|nr:AzlD domain-containing protein [Desulfovibrionaceae bacterium]
MDQKTIFLTICAMAAVTYLPRLLPALALSSRRLPEWVERWLTYVPAAVLAALLFPGVLAPHGAPDVSGDNLFFWAALPTAAVALATRSLFLTVAVGMAIVAAARLLGF